MCDFDGALWEQPLFNATSKIKHHKSNIINQTSHKSKGWYAEAAPKYFHPSCTLQSCRHRHIRQIYDTLVRRNVYDFDVRCAIFDGLLRQPFRPPPIENRTSQIKHQKSKKGGLLKQHKSATIFTSHAAPSILAAIGCHLSGKTSDIIRYF